MVFVVRSGSFLMRDPVLTEAVPETNSLHFVSRST